MHGRFAQSQTREDHLASPAEDIEHDISCDPEPTGGYNVTSGTKILLLSERDEHLHLDPVFRGYVSGRWDKPPLINVRIETAVAGRMLKPLWQHGRVICSANSWFKWKKEGDKKRPYFTYRVDGQLVSIAAIGGTPLERGDETEGVLIVTAAVDQGPVDVHDRRPLVLLLETAREWMRRDTGGKETSGIATRSCVPVNQFIWYPALCAVNDVKNQGTGLIQSA